MYVLIWGECYSVHCAVPGENRLQLGGFGVFVGFHGNRRYWASADGSLR